MLEYCHNKQAAPLPLPPPRFSYARPNSILPFSVSTPMSPAIITMSFPRVTLFGEQQALHYLETISPQSLLAQLLSALLGLSMFVLEEASSSHEGGLPVVKVKPEFLRVVSRRILNKGA